MTSPTFQQRLRAARDEALATVAGFSEVRAALFATCEREESTEHPTEWKRVIRFIDKQIVSYERVAHKAQASIDGYSTAIHNDDMRRRSPHGPALAEAGKAWSTPPEGSISESGPDDPWPDTEDWPTTFARTTIRSTEEPILAAWLSDQS